MRAGPASRLLISLLATSAPALAVNQQFGLTAYGEPCTDTCKQRGFPYAWCHKKPSWNGTYLSMAECDQSSGVESNNDIFRS